MLILASSSPRRKEILSSIYNKDFKIYPSNIDERSISFDKKENLPLILSIHKGLNVSKIFPTSYVLSCDTVVILNDEILNKPKDEKEAFIMLKKENNQIQKVISAYSIILNEKILIKRSITAELIISFKDEKTILDYIKTKSCFDKAGGYGIQDKDYVKSKIISGNFDTIKGLPSKELEIDLKNLKLI